MPLCFAYGSNMDTAAMAERCPRSRAIGVGRLLRHRFVIMPQGFANVVRDPHASVHGVLWDIALSDIRALDAYEGVSSGLYRKVMQPIMKAGGGSARSLVYMGQGEGGQANAAYLDGVIAAARVWALPQQYIASIERLAPGIRKGGSAAVVVGTTPKVRPRFATPFDR